MNLIKIAARIANSYSIASLPPLSELKGTVEEIMAGATDPDMIELLQDIIDSCEAGSSRAYLLMEDLVEMQDELNVEHPIHSEELYASST